MSPDLIRWPYKSNVRKKFLPPRLSTQSRDFEGRRGKRLRAGAHTETPVALRAPAAGPPPAGGDERGARKREASASLSLRRAVQRRPGSHSSRPGRRVPTREAARRRGGLRRNNKK